MNDLAISNYLEIFLSYEVFEEAVNKNNWNSLLLIEYKILFRRWDLINSNEIAKYKECKTLRPTAKTTISWSETNISIGELVEFNAGYYNKAQLENVECVGELGYYTDPIINNKSIIDVFFCGVFPILNVKKYNVQIRASRMLQNCPFHMVFDEVGTGKTVTALYCIRDVLIDKASLSKILIICPNNKITEWIKDIQRQLGLYAHEVSSQTDDMVYKNELKTIYFKEGEPCVFVEGQKKSEKKETLDTWDEEKWDLTIIDECHLCFENYKNIRSEKLLILTATPIVINSQSIDGILNISKERKIQEYIDLAKDITECQEHIQINNLFSNSKYFTQLFREDLGIIPKQRKIRFAYADRLYNRDEYLDVLRTAVGGMARLIYEQDDEFLMYGIFNKFRKKIEEEGYYLPDDPEPFENTKYKALVNVINELETKSYIVFFNSKWPAENVYNRLINEFANSENKVVVAIKFGKTMCKVWPRDNTVNSDNVFDYLFSKIESGCRVIFITTGVTGGTGLNLGRFDGIINYEMPFTSIELEQRFGRVDRMDVAKGQEREMIFLLNSDYNPMLRYCLLKINKTCLHMPIRNTILFCPEVIQQISNDLEKEFISYKLSDDELDYIKKKNSLSNSERDMIELFEKHISRRKSANDFSEDISSLSTDCVKLMEYMQNNEGMVRRLSIKRKGLDIIKSELMNWLRIIGIESDINTEIEIGSVLLASDEDNDDFIDESSQEMSSKIVMGNLVIEEHDNYGYQSDAIDIEQMLNQLKSSITETQNGSGVFYIDHGYHRDTVEQYRKKCPLEEM